MTGYQVELPEVTYVGVLPRREVTGDNSIEKLLRIGYVTSRHVNFGERVVFTAQKPNCETYGFKIVEIENLPFDHYTAWALQNFQHMFSTPFMINFHSDGMIQNPSGWDHEFLSYDYIGAPWPEDRISGNGGFSLRSKKLCELAADLDMAPHFPQRGIMDNEDVLVCRTYREYFVDNGCRFAPAEVAEKFSTEHYASNHRNFKDSFGFHEIESISNENLKSYRRERLGSILLTS